MDEKIKDPLNNRQKITNRQLDFYKRNFRQYFNANLLILQVSTNTRGLAMDP